MKIAIITSPFGYLPPYGYGAVEKLWYDLSYEMIKVGASVLLISKEHESLSKKVTCKNQIDFLFIKGYSRTGSLFKDILLDLIYSWEALRILNKTDILVMNTFWSPILSIFFKKKFNISVYNVARFPKGQFKFYWHIDRLSCVSFSVYKELIKQIPHSNKQAKVISNPINTKVFYYQPKKSQNRLETRVIYSGRIHPEKGLGLLVEACDLLKDKFPYLHLSLMGPRSIKDGGGGDLFIDELNSKAKKIIIEWIDPVSDPFILRDEIAKADIFCYPSIAEKGETFGVSPLEGMATGTATVVSGLECFQDFIQDGTNGLVFNHRAKNAVFLLVEKLELLIKDSDLREKLAIEGAKTATNFSNEKISKKYLNDFNDLLKNDYYHA